MRVSPNSYSSAALIIHSPKANVSDRLGTAIRVITNLQAIHAVLTPGTRRDQHGTGRNSLDRDLHLLFADSSSDSVVVVLRLRGLAVEREVGKVGVMASYLAAPLGNDKPWSTA